MIQKLSLLYNIQKVLRNFDILVRGKRPSLAKRRGQERFIPLLFYTYEYGKDPYVESDYFI